MRARRNGMVLAATALLSAACGSSSGGSAGSATGGAQPAGGGGDVTGKSSLDVATTNYAFSPAVLNGTPGQKLTIHLTNSSGTAHNFTLADQKINTDLPTGKATDVTVTFPATGQLVFTCEYHASKGMKGTLVAGSGPASPAASSGGGSSGGTSGY
jgi:plastocyanin